MRYTFFLAHPKSMDEAEIKQTRDAVLDYMTTRRPTDEIFLVTGREDYEANFNRCGSWDAWAEDVAVGVVYPLGTARYDGFVATDRTVGAATARILDRALGARKSVWVWTGQALFPATRVTRVSQDFKNGWRLT